MVAGVLVDFGHACAARPLVLGDGAVEVPHTVHEDRDALGAAQIGLQPELHGGAKPVMDQVLEPAPFEIGGPHGLRLIARYQQAGVIPDGLGQLDDD